MNQKSLFFRNDDLGWMPQQFERLMNLFRKHEIVLCTAAIPLYCHDSYKKGAFSQDKGLLEIHSHGYSHLDHQTQGKKAEFGSQRTLEGVSHDLQKSLQITRDLFPDLYFEAFTPPWNRIDDDFIPVLKESGFKVLSRDGDKAAQVPGLLEINIHVDVHTSKKGKITSPQGIWQQVESQWQNSALCGVMLHHKHMEDTDFETLDLFLMEVKSKGIPVLSYKDIWSAQEATLV
ncbi:DUF2334 domain-containing protein [Bdellovibrio svalbardensis]|uniref:Polysaccharide deacetylase n=1 Tax=Bdellovibrio svalbardensis TaxID=2972972 RepID=A0ABT6DHJ6_9BACT|nr:DUF2334 domain-containing protein [Bdellovibrio svalbardensis]MDG0816282.1 hypothetical protein [Bdellovibrio svalbardensis]